MANDPLATVITIRRRAVDEMRGKLSTSLAAAATAHQEARDAERSIEEETLRAADPSGSDTLVEAFAAWLPGARDRAARACALQDRREADVARCRAELAASRIALESVEALVDLRHAEARAEEARKASIAMDEIASRMTKA